MQPQSIGEDEDAPLMAVIDQLLGEYVPVDIDRIGLDRSNLGQISILTQRRHRTGTRFDLLELRLRLEPAALLDRIVELAERVGDLAAADDQLEAVKRASKRRAERAGCPAIVLTVDTKMGLNYARNNETLTRAKFEELTADLGGGATVGDGLENFLLAFRERPGVVGRLRVDGLLDATLLEPGQVTGLDAVGVPSKLVVLSVGYGSNYLSAISVGGRLVLHNGSHRAYALRAAGQTHAPCLVQHVSRHEELRAIVDEAHRLRKKVAAHCHGDDAVNACIDAGIAWVGPRPELLDQLGDIDALENLLRNATSPGPLAEVDLDKVRELLGDAIVDRVDRPVELQTRFEAEPGRRIGERLVQTTTKTLR